MNKLFTSLYLKIMKLSKPVREHCYFWVRSYWTDGMKFFLQLGMFFYTNHQHYRFKLIDDFLILNSIPVITLKSWKCEQTPIMYDNGSCRSKILVRFSILFNHLRFAGLHEKKRQVSAAIRKKKENKMHWWKQKRKKCYNWNSRSVRVGSKSASIWFLSLSRGSKWCSCDRLPYVANSFRMHNPI